MILLNIFCIGRFKDYIYIYVCVCVFVCVCVCVCVFIKASTRARDDIWWIFKRSLAVRIKSISSPKPVAIPMLKTSVCPTIHQ